MYYTVFDFLFSQIFSFIRENYANSINESGQRRIVVLKHLDEYHADHPYYVSRDEYTGKTREQIHQNALHRLIFGFFASKLARSNIAELTEMLLKLPADTASSVDPKYRIHLPEVKYFINLLHQAPDYLSNEFAVGMTLHHCLVRIL